VAVYAAAVPAPPVGPDGSSSAEPVPYADATHSVLTPMGQVESAGNFARGLGARRIKAFGAVVLVACLALLALSVF
jgi:hypothetical protein